MEEWEAQRIRDEEHLGILGIFNFVVAGLCLFGMLAFVPHLIMVQSGMFDRMFEKQWEKIEDRGERWEERSGEEFPVAFDRETGEFLKKTLQVFVVGFMLLTAVAGALCLLSGFGLRARRRRGLSIVVAVLQCFAMPVGTVLGVFTLVVLGRTSVQELYLDTEEPGWADEEEGTA